jgi:FkbM family methyltransferase
LRENPSWFALRCRPMDRLTPLAPSAEELDRERVVEAETEVGKIWLEREAELMTPVVLREGRWATEITALMRSALRPGMTFVDAGANIGYFSVLAAKLVGPSGRVFCVEADPANVQILRANLFENGCANATVFPVAAWTERTELNLAVNPSGGAGSWVGTGAPEDMKVPAFRLDELIVGSVDYMKVDCESSDHMVVSGAAGLIESNPAMLITVEFNPDHTTQSGHAGMDVLAIYQDLGLRPYGIRPWGALNKTTFEALAQSGSGDGMTIFDFALARRLPARLWLGSRLDLARRSFDRALRAGGDLLERVPERWRPPIRNRDRDARRRQRSAR